MTLRSRQAGLSLIELMIAIALAAFLLVGLIQIFTASSQAYRTSVGLSRIQEGSRFSFEFMQRDLRMAGHMGWANDVARMYSGTYPAPSANFAVTQFDNLMAPDNNPANGVNSMGEFAAAPFAFRFDTAIQGFEATGTSPGDTVALAGRAAGAVADWTPNLDGVFFADVNPKPLRGSDIVVMRALGQDGVPVTFNKDTPSITFIAASDAGFIEAGRYYGIANYGAAAVFQAPPVVSPTATLINLQVGAGTTNQHGFFGASEVLRGNVVLYPANIYAYYVGLGASNIPSLFRATYSGTAWTSEELVEGVEMLQLTYGRDTLSQRGAGGAFTPCGAGGSCFPDGSVDEYLTAAQVVLGLTTEVDRAARWRSIGAVRLGVLLRSPERAGTPDRDELATGNLQISRTVIDLPEGDAILRRPYESTVALRNRLYGN